MASVRNEDNRKHSENVAKKSQFVALMLKRDSQEPITDRKRLSKWVMRISRGLCDKLRKDAESNLRFATKLCLGNVDRAHRAPQEYYPVELPEDLSCWNDATSLDVEASLLKVIAPIDLNHVWYELRLYASEFISVNTPIRPDENGTASDSSDDPYLPSTNRHLRSQDQAGHQISSNAQSQPLHSESIAQVQSQQISSNHPIVIPAPSQQPQPPPCALDLRDADFVLQPHRPLNLSPIKMSNNVGITTTQSPQTQSARVEGSSKNFASVASSGRQDDLMSLDEINDSIRSNGGVSFSQVQQRDESSTDTETESETDSDDDPTLIRSQRRNLRINQQRTGNFIQKRVVAPHSSSQRRSYNQSQSSSQSIRTLRGRSVGTPTPGTKSQKTRGNKKNYIDFFEEGAETESSSSSRSSTDSTISSSSSNSSDKTKVDSDSDSDIEVIGTTIKENHNIDTENQHPIDKTLDSQAKLSSNSESFFCRKKIELAHLNNIEESKLRMLRSHNSFVRTDVIQQNITDDDLTVVNNNNDTIIDPKPKQTKGHKKSKASSRLLPGQSTIDSFFSKCPRKPLAQ